MSQSPVIIHYHIFKNAGTSIDAMLMSSFGSAWRAFDGTHPHDVKTAAEVQAFLALNPDVQALSTHLGRPASGAIGILPITFLRHPILRARSVFEFLRHDASHPGPKDSFSQFVAWGLGSRDGGIVIRDYQVVHLSSASYCKPTILEAKATPENLSEACALINAWLVVGIVEEFEKSLAVFQRRYSSKLPSLNLQPVWLNRSRASLHGSAEESIEEIRKELGASLYARLTEANQLDLQLYEHGRTVLQAAAESGSSQGH